MPQDFERRPYSNDEHSFRVAALGVVDSTQRLIADQLELLKLDLKAFAQQRALGVGMLAVAAFFSVLGYLAIMAALLGLLLLWMDYRLALVILGAAHLLTGALLAAGASKRMRENPLKEDVSELRPPSLKAEHLALRQAEEYMSPESRPH